MVSLEPVWKRCVGATIFINFFEPTSSDYIYLFYLFFFREIICLCMHAFTACLTLKTMPLLNVLFFIGHFNYRIGDKGPLVVMGS